MSYATLMVDVDAGGDELDGRVTIAADLADQFDAHLIGIAGWGPMALFLDPEELSRPTQPHLQDMKTLLDLKGEQFRAAVGRRPRGVEWRSVLDLPTEVVAREARTADLVIVGNERQTRDPFRALDVGSLLLKAGRPVLIVPKTVTSFTPKRIMIAWKDVREARRAVRDALPFLRQAESVLIVEVSEWGEGNGALHGVKDVAGYLNRHRIDIIAERVRPAEVTVIDALLRAIEDENIDLIVAGAYGHSRLGEWVFGGVTRDLLAESPICCLLSH
jgi:nucleotide-binding universal stress UspA family protein